MVFSKFCSVRLHRHFPTTACALQHRWSRYAPYHLVRQRLPNCGAGHGATLSLEHRCSSSLPQLESVFAHARCRWPRLSHHSKPLCAPQPRSREEPRWHHHSRQQKHLQECLWRFCQLDERRLLGSEKNRNLNALRSGPLDPRRLQLGHRRIHRSPQRVAAALARVGHLTSGPGGQSASGHRHCRLLPGCHPKPRRLGRMEKDGRCQRQQGSSHPTHRHQQRRWHLSSCSSARPLREAPNCTRSTWHHASKQTIRVWQS